MNWNQQQKRGIGVTLTLSSSVFRTNKTNFSRNFLSVDRQVSSILKAFAKNSSANIPLSKIQLFQTKQSNGFLLDFSANLCQLPYHVIR